MEGDRDMNEIFDIATEEAEDNYEPYGKEWEREMMKHTKMELIDFLKKAWKKQKGQSR